MPQNFEIQSNLYRTRGVKAGLVWGKGWKVQIFSNKFSMTSFWDPFEVAYRKLK